MEIIRQRAPEDLKRWVDKHILTVAEEGFSKLNIYATKLHDLDVSEVRTFANKVNERDEAGTLYPQMPISAMPKRFFRNSGIEAGSEKLAEFKRMLAGFLAVNERDIHAKEIVVDWHVSAEPVPEVLLQVTEDVFQIQADSVCIERVIIVND